MSELISIEAGGGVLFRPAESGNNFEIVTIYRRGKWDLPKGKLEDDETIQECAIREVCEEIGLDSPPKIVSFLDETVHEYQRNGSQFQKSTYWFCMNISRNASAAFVPQEIEGIEKVEWMNTSDAKELAGYQNIVDLICLFEKRMVPQKGLVK